MPGGATWFNQTNGYSEAGRHIYDIAIEMNNRGEYMPIFGTCLGFELLSYLSANGQEHREDCYSERQPLALEFEDGLYYNHLIDDSWLIYFFENNRF